ncbi:MAG TPA: hypothetical protein VGE52_15290 [Pirellulales bacterium]
MTSSVLDVAAVEAVDLIAELKFRRWARENYVPASQRDPQWHPIVLDEMNRKELELTQPVAG